MLDTHYEKYIRRLQPHRSRMRKLLADMFRDPKLKDISGTWIPNLLANNGIINVLGTRMNLLPNDGPLDGLSDSFDAFTHELFNLWYTEGGTDKEDEPLSITRTLLNNPNFLIFHSLMSERLGAGPAQTMAELSYQLLNHERAGQKVYEITPGLTDGLLATELKGVKCEDVLLPFPNIYITVPSNTNFRVWNDATGWHDVVGIYLSEDPNARREPTGKDIHVDKNGNIQVADKVAYEDRPVLREWSAMIVGGPARDEKGKEIPLDDALYYFRLYFPEGQSIDKSIEEVVERQGQGIAGHKRSMLYDQMSEIWISIFRWALNVVVYATYSDPGDRIFGNKDARKLWERIDAAPKGSKTRKHLMLKAEGVNPQRRLLLGKHITVSRHGPIQVPGGGQRGALNVRVRVSGFWRNQPYGKGRAFRRMKWIEPFWRGPDMAEVSSNRHRLK